MIPMRSIPFRHIFLVGFGQDVYPRRSETSGFDLMARHRMRGDRDRRDEDRYMFLEAIFSARKSLTISYVGRDMHSNQELEPSVLVSELLDYCGRTFMSERMEKDLSALRESVRENSRKIAESAQSGAGTDRELLRASFPSLSRGSPTRRKTSLRAAAALSAPTGASGAPRPPRSTLSRRQRRTGAQTLLTYSFRTARSSRLMTTTSKGRSSQASW